MSRRLFECFGVELEYMLVDLRTLDVAPLADRLLMAAAGGAEIVNDVDFERTSWSNELALHVIEFKTNGPPPTLDGLAEAFQADVRRANRLASPLGARLMPGGMHPWMAPLREARLWPHDYSPVYEAFNRIFDCRGHGWSNLQSAHLNLPFGDDAEFARLHAGIRLLLPLLPALAASSPILDGRPSGLADTRLEVYRSNARRVPSVSGRVIPEPVFSRAAYEREILERIYADLAPHDPQGVLRHEWANARGAIARFERNTIEIRVLDVQECPAADLAILRLIVAALKALVGERWTSLTEQQSWSVERLERIFLATIRDADQALIDEEAYLKALGVSGARATAGEVWTAIAEALGQSGDPALKTILNEGCLARRIVRRVGLRPRQEALFALAGELCDCLQQGRLLAGGS